MAGIGVRLNKIFEKRSITADLVGFAYSTVATAAPMFLVILTILLMQHVLGTLAWTRRPLALKGRTIR